MTRSAFLLIGVLLSTSASAQVDISGNWVSSQENIRPRENAGIGDYTGLPLNDAGRLRADTWDASVLSQRERQAQPHNTQYYQFRAAARIEKVIDPATKQLIAYNLCCEFGGMDRTIWLDGRPHPPEYAERTWQGFSTGQWVGNTLTVTTTHLRTGFIERNGAPGERQKHRRRTLHPARRPVDPGPVRRRSRVLRDAADSDDGLRAEPRGHAPACPSAAGNRR